MFEMIYLDLRFVINGPLQFIVIFLNCFNLKFKYSQHAKIKDV